MALAVVLVLLLGLVVIALGGLGGAVADLAVAALDEQAALAMEAAEAGVARTLRTGVPIPAATPAWPGLFPGLTLSSEIQFDPPVPSQPLPDGANLSDGGDMLPARHFTIRAEGRAGHGAVVRIEQGFKVIGREDGLWAIGCAGEDCAADSSPIVVGPDTLPALRSDPVRTSWRQLDTTSE